MTYKATCPNVVSTQLVASTIVLRAAALGANGSPYESEIFPDHGGGRERGDVRHIIGRRHLDDVHAKEPQAAKSPHNRLCLPGSQSADLRCPGSWSECRIKRINVEGQIACRVAEHGPNAFGHDLRPLLVHFLRGDDGDALFESPIEHRALDRRSDADLDDVAAVDETLLDRVIKHGSMPIGLTEAVGPSVDMRIEMHERKRAGPPGQGSQQGPRHTVIATQCYQVRQ